MKLPQLPQLEMNRHGKLLSANLPGYQSMLLYAVATGDHALQKDLQENFKIAEDGAVRIGWFGKHDGEDTSTEAL